MNTVSILPTTDDLRQAIIDLAVDGHAPSVAIFKIAKCGEGNPERWVTPATICVAYGVERSVEGWATLCYRLTGLVTADRSHYMAITYDAKKRQVAASVASQTLNPPRTPRREPPPRRLQRVRVLRYSFVRREFYQDFVLMG